MSNLCNCAKIFNIIIKEINIPLENVNHALGNIVKNIVNVIRVGLHIYRLKHKKEGRYPLTINNFTKMYIKS